jgi:phosphoribosylformylglycinamidine synthase subunit PurL
MTTDGAERHCAIDPRGGGRAVVLESARNLACVGAEPLAVTNCLNFANPEKGHTGWRLAETIAGMSEVCRALGTPVVSGNVSLYNESAERIIHPTPVVGMVGLIDDVHRTVGSAFVAEGDRIILAGAVTGRIDASEYLGDALGSPLRPDIDAEVALIRAVTAAVRGGKVRSAHDASTGGIAVAVAECAITSGLGATVGLPAGRRTDEVLFGEGPGQVLLTCSAADAASLIADLTAAGVPAQDIGLVGGATATITVGDVTTEVDLAAADNAWRNGLEVACTS